MGMGQRKLGLYGRTRLVLGVFGSGYLGGRKALVGWVWLSVMIHKEVLFL